MKTQKVNIEIDFLKIMLRSIELHSMELHSVRLRSMEFHLVKLRSIALSGAAIKRKS